MPETTKNVNKVVYGGKVLIDLTGDTVTPGTLLTGTTAHDKSGAAITGTMEASEMVNAQERSVVPSVEEQVVLPEEGDRGRHPLCGERERCWRGHRHDCGVMECR